MAFDQGAFEKSLAVIAANRQDYSSGFRPGTQTLAGRKFDEDTRQFNEKFAEDKYRDRRDFREGVRQFDAKLSADVMGAKLGVSDSGGGGGEYGPLKGLTSKQKEAMAESEFLQALSDQYTILKGSGSTRPLAGTVDWVAAKGREYFPTISEERRKELAYNYIKDAGTRAPNQSAADIVLQHKYFTTKPKEKDDADTSALWPNTDTGHL